ncbi:hypothetical protein DHEL01_v206606 [Diaporthe helianthi]|uniref:Mid2 domain-containing protein n=1 Tax=Diaporthe helianthi TaxID=158607 RepID=A0A2P5HXL8_DIAHE|nr:hypothetical protein DHEL01_v206606 [Diaporthe helianthi]
MQGQTGQVILKPDVAKSLDKNLKEFLFFRVDWSLSAKRDGQQNLQNSSYSQEWVIVEDEAAATSIFDVYSSQVTAGAPAAREPGPSPTYISAITDTAASSGTFPSTTSSQTTPSAAAGNSGTKTRGLTTGAIVGIVVGVVGGLILVSVIAGYLCFRRRRGAGVERGGSRGVQDIIAEKEAHTSILDRDQPGTPYSEQNSQQPLNRGLGLAGRNESGLDLGTGQAMSGPGSIRSESLHTVAAAGNGNNRNSAAYSSLGGGAVNSAHGTPVMGSGAFASRSPRTQPHTPSISAHDRSSVMGSPVPRASSPLDRALSPYRDDVGQFEYSQYHQHMVDGADLVQQEHSNRDSVTVRSPSSIYSTNPLDEAQPISPESASEARQGAAVGVIGGSGSGSSARGPPGHGRSTTPSGISGKYAHLVEEGMTDDQIRRLEEEERALDEAIEQAGATARKT